MKKYIFALCLFMAGCISINPKIETVKQWEGHYYTIEEFNEKTSNIQLEENETIWVLSNRTLKRVLKNTTK